MNSKANNNIETLMVKYNDLIKRVRQFEDAETKTLFDEIKSALNNTSEKIAFFGSGTASPFSNSKPNASLPAKSSGFGGFGIS